MTSEIEIAGITKFFKNQALADALMNEVLNCVIESRDKPEWLQKLVDGSYNKQRSQLHCLFISPFSTGKSKIALKIPCSYKLTEFSKAGIQGTVSKTGMFQHPIVFNAKHKVLVMDEIQLLAGGSYQAMQSLLEDQFYSKGIAYNITNEKGFRKKGVWLKVEKEGKGYSFGVTFSCVGFGEFYNKAMRGNPAFRSRFLNFPLRIQKVDSFDLAKGSPILDISPKEIKGGYGIVKFDGWCDFVDECEKASKISLKEELCGFYTRLVNDLGRLIVSKVRQSGRLTVEKKDWVSYPVLMDFFTYTFNLSSLNKIELRICQALYQGITGVTELSKACNTSRRHVWRCIKHLKEEMIL